MRISSLDSWIKDRIGYTVDKDFRQEIDRYTLNKLQENIEYVKENSPFYKKYFRGIERIESFEEFQNLPFTSAGDLLYKSNSFVCVPQNSINRIVTMQSSGTSGLSKRIFFTREDQELSIDFFQNGMLTVLDRGYKTLILLPSRREGSVADLLQKGLKRIQVDSYIYDDLFNEDKLFEIIREKSIDTIVGSPIQLHRLAVYANHRGKINLKSILLSTDYAPRAIIERIKKIFNCKVYDHYGMTEMGLGGGVECDAFHGFHLREADLYFEIIDPYTEKILPYGEYGEVVFTTLTRRGMPLIRYRTGDTTRLIVSPCICGSGIRRLDRIQTRLEACTMLYDGKVLMLGELSEAMFSIDGIIDFHTTITEEKGKDCLNIYVDSLPREDNLLDDVYDKLMGISIIYRLIKNDRLILNIERNGDSIRQDDFNAKKKINDMRNMR